MSAALAVSRGLARAHVLFLTIGVVLVVLAAAIIVGLATPRGNGGNGAQAIRVDKVSLDEVDAPNGYSFYLVEVNASNGGSSVWHLNPSLFTMASNASTYLPNDVYNRTVLMGRVNVSAGRSTVGQVAFELPAKEVPAALRYADAGAGINIGVSNVPPVTSVASKFEFYVHLSVNGTGPWVKSIISYGAVDDFNNSLVYFTGQRVEIGFTFQYYKQPVDPQRVVVRSITSDDGFTLSGGPNFPLVLMGWGDQADPLLFFTVPPGQHSGILRFAVQFST